MSVPAWSIFLSVCLSRRVSARLPCGIISVKTVINAKTIKQTNKQETIINAKKSYINAKYYYEHKKTYQNVFKKTILNAKIQLYLKNHINEKKTIIPMQKTI